MSNRLSTRTQVMYDVDAERDRQDDKWGEQNHPDGTGLYAQPLKPICLDQTMARALAELSTESTDAAAEQGSVTWRDILLEEVFEALAESDPVTLRNELIQVAAGAAQWAEAIDRRGIEAWETEDPTLIVIGTHDPAAAYPVAKRFYEQGMDVPEDLETAIHCEAMGQWVDPKVVQDERWPDDHVSTKRVEGWTPFLAVTW